MSAPLLWLCKWICISLCELVSSYWFAFKAGQFTYIIFVCFDSYRCTVYEYFCEIHLAFYFIIENWKCDNIAIFSLDVVFMHRTVKIVFWCSAWFSNYQSCVLVNLIVSFDTKREKKSSFNQQMASHMEFRERSRKKNHWS